MQLRYLRRVASSHTCLPPAGSRRTQNHIVYFGQEALTIVWIQVISSCSSMLRPKKSLWTVEVMRLGSLFVENI